MDMSIVHAKTLAIESPIAKFAYKIDQEWFAIM